MKTCFRLIVVFLVIAVLVPPVEAQVLEREVTQGLSKDAQKGELFNFAFDETNQQLTLVFKREKKKKVIYEIYQFDRNLKLIKNETLEEAVAQKEYPQAANVAAAPVDPWNDPTVIRVDPSMSGQIVLRQGNLTREWTTQVEDRGNYRYTTNYWKYDFQETQRVKPKFEGLVDIPEGAPGWVIKMAQNAGEKVVLLTYATDEPVVEVTTGRQSLVYGSIWARTRDYSSASGDILIVGRSDQMDYDTKVPKQVFLLMKFSATDLSEIHRETFTFDYNIQLVFNKVLDDGTMALVFAPDSYPGLKNKNPNPCAWEYIRVSKDATIIDRIPFESVGGWWAINDAVLGKDGAVYLYGGALAKKKNKHYSTATPLSEFDNMQVIKIAASQVAYTASATLDEMEKKLAVPGNQKKTKAFNGKELTLNQISVLTSSGDLIFSGQATDQSALYSFHFGPTGAFAGQYVINTVNQSKEHGFDHFMFENPDGATATLYLGELEGIDNGRALKIPRMATIDIAAAKISDINTYGFDKKGEYYLDDVFPFTFIDNGERVILFSRDGKDSEIWLGCLKFGK